MTPTGNAHIAGQKRNIFLFIIWSKARKFEDEIRADLAHHFKIVHECEITWPRWDFTRRLWDFYGFGTRFMWWNKGRKCGRGPFKVIVVEDPNPVWKEQFDTCGQKLLVDDSVYQAKKSFRQLTGHSNIIHSSDTSEETRSQLEALDLDYLIPPSSSSLIPLFSSLSFSSLIPHPSSLEQRLDRGELKFLGAGSRRECYEIPGTGLCLKCYRKAEDVTDATVKREIIHYAHDEKHSTCCQEYRYYRELKRTLPPYLFAAFPDEMRQIHLPKRGWAIIERLFCNEDGSECVRFSRTYRAAPKELQAKLLSDFWLLVGGLSSYAVRFYDTQNIIVQHGVGGFNLRIVDFEPVARTLIPIDSICPNLICRKVIRRARRYVGCHLKVKPHYNGLAPALRRKWDSIIAIEGARIGLSNCRAFLENKYVNDIFYSGTYKGRSCIVKCSSKAPYSIRNEYEMSKSIFDIDPRVCAEPLAHWESRDGRMAFVVMERLPGPTLTSVRQDPAMATQLVDGIADDFVRMANALRETGIVHGDMGTTDNYLMGTDGHLRLIDFQFAVDRSRGCVDPWLLAHVKYHYVILSCHIRLGTVFWNDAAYLVSHLRERLPMTSHARLVADELCGRVFGSVFGKVLSARERLVLRAYHLSLWLQIAVAKIGFRKYDVLRYRSERCRINGPHTTLTSPVKADGAINKLFFEMLRGQNINVLPPGTEVPCYETFDAGKLCQHPIVSVVMTIYNHEKFIEQAVKGVLEQRTSFEYEILLCEDHSPDRSLEICFKFQKAHPDKIKVLWYDENVSRLGGNGNRALARCRGEFIAFCEGDDYWVNPDKLEKQVALMRKYPTCGICFAGTDYFSEDESKVTTSFDPTHVPHEFESGRKIVERVILGSAVSYGIYGPARHTSTLMYRNEVFHRAVEDYPEVCRWSWRFGDTITLAAIAAVSDVCFLRERASVYRLNDTGITRRTPALLMRDVHTFNVLAAISLLKFTGRDALSYFADKLVWSWFLCARLGSDEVRREIYGRIVQFPDMAALFAVFHRRGLFAAISGGQFHGFRFKCARLHFILVSAVRKFYLRRKYAL